ncbi:MAG: phosphotransferase [Erysipelotrichaceae bacterium]|nr:phosphotransferase [Erysipelotrichaceae bacterium]
MDRKIIAKRENKDIYIEDGKCYKVFDGKDKADILNEALNHARVEQTGLHIPALLEVTTIDDRWAIVTKYIEGKTMAELFDEQPEKEDELMERFIDIQIDMQSKRCPLLSKHRDKMNRKISETDLSATLRYDLHRRIEKQPRHNDLCHGDYNPSNVIIDKDDNAYIIDWSHATQGNSEADCARTFLLFLLEGKKERARKYLKRFCEKKGCDHINVLRWLPILSASQSVKGFPDESEFLHSLIFMNTKQLEELYA